MKIRIERLSFMGFTMALFVLSLMAYQSSHRLFEHHDEGEAEHEECSMCDWQFAPVESGLIFRVPLISVQQSIDHTSEVLAGEVVSPIFSFDGRGPPMV